MKKLILLLVFISVLSNGNAGDIKLPPSVIFVHGLGGSEQTWQELISALDPARFVYMSNYRIVESANFEVIEERKSTRSISDDGTLIPVFTITFQDNQNLSFVEQGQRLRMVVNDVRSITGNREVILFGHSMGGLAARACIGLNPDGIAGLVTAGTPHAGSFLGYAPNIKKEPGVKYFLLSELLEGIAGSIDLKLSSKAIRMLAPDSPEMLQMYNQVFPPDMPMVNVVSRWDPGEKLTILDWFKDYLDSLNAFLIVYKSKNPVPADIMSMNIQLKFNDGVVSIPSQYIKTGVANPAELQPAIFETDRFHMFIPQDKTCMMDALNEILRMVQTNNTSGNKGKHKTTLGFIIDSSSSMTSSDPQDVRKSGVEEIVDLLTGDENVFLVDFDDRGTWLNPGSWNNWNRQQLKSDISRINSSGNTNVGLGIRTMQQALEQNIADFTNTAVVLLSDGMGAYNNEAEWFLNHGIKIYTISYKDKADANMLNNIASNTGGLYFQANTESDIVAAFMQFNNDILGLNKYISFRGKFNNSSSAAVPSFYADPRTKVLTAIMSSSGINKLFSLISPSGIRYSYSPFFSSSAVSSEPVSFSLFASETIFENGSGPFFEGKATESESMVTGKAPEWIKGNGYLIARISDAEAGQWKANIFTDGNLPSTDPFLFEVNGASDVNLPLETNNAGGYYTFRIVNNNSTIKLSNSKGEIKLETPTGKVLDISQSYNGGAFKFYPADGIGNYQIDAKILIKDGLNNTYQRQYFRSILVGEILPGYLAPVIETMGAYIITQQGIITGNRPGIKCTIYSPGGSSSSRKAVGTVTHVNQNECTIKITDMISGRIEKGDMVELDMIQWQNDKK